MLYTFTIEGNLTADPELRHTDSGLAVAQFRMVYNSRRRDANGEWVDGKSVWITVTCWRQLAERVATLRRGDTVIIDAADDLRAEAYGGGANLRVTANNVALSMRWAGASSHRNARRTEPSGDTVVTADGEEIDAEAYADYAEQRALAAVN
ncbi:single-stranded DNA-binding protein [Hamadaea sp. NPDC051192]|uniref:single-stranded DNA-binding protein n=1 Tax=Hamadaea sp. NPDC051192 TaxID=3154940 RepID=UPI00343B166F